MGMISGKVVGDRPEVTFPNNLLFRYASNYSIWVKVPVRADRYLLATNVSAGTWHIFIYHNNCSNKRWVLVDSPHPFNVLPVPQNITVSI